VIVIIGVLLSPALNALFLSQKATHAISTRKDLKEISKAMTLYYQINARLPCPADITLDISNASSATENCVAGLTANSGDIIYGAVPVDTIGMSSSYLTDGWKNKYSYYVLAEATNGVLTHTSTDIYTTDHNLGANEAEAVFVVISHGEDGRGAYRETGIQIPSTGATSDETKNIYTNTSKVIDTSNRLAISDGGINDISISSKGADIINEPL